jgi:beta-phosphoglucomutase
MLKAIVFDFDGVIVDSEPLHYRAFLKVAEPLGVHFSYDEYLARYIGYDDRDSFRVMLGMEPGVQGTPEEQAEIGELVRRKGEAFQEVVRAGVDAIPGVPDLVREAAAAMPLTIASGATSQDIDTILGGMRMKPLFTAIVTADRVPRSKPDPASYALAVADLARARPDLALTPGDCLAIEDTAAGIESARGAGLRTLGLATTGPAEKLRRADRVLDGAAGLTLAKLREWFG